VELQGRIVPSWEWATDWQLWACRLSHVLGLIAVLTLLAASAGPTSCLPPESFPLLPLRCGALALSQESCAEPSGSAAILAAPVW